MGRILIGGDGDGVTRSLAVLMRADGMVVQEAQQPRNVVQGVEADLCDLLIVDMGMQGGEGLNLIAECSAADPDIPILAVAHKGTIDEAMAACEKGAFDYLTTPINPKKFTQTIHRWLDQEGQGSGAQSSVVRLQHEFRISKIIAESPAMTAVCERVQCLGPAEIPICLLGPKGSGRSAVAAALHEWSPRKAEPMKVVSCREVSDEKLFGETEQKKLKRRSDKSILMQADRGTLYLRDAEELSEKAQRLLLSIINDRELPITGGDSVPVDTRLIFSFGHPLGETLEEGRLLQEFVERVSVVSVKMPELNDRRADILPLISFLLHDADGEQPGKEYTISSVGAEMMERFSWPGGITQLMGVAEKHLIPNRNQFISADALPEEIFDHRALENPMNDSKGPHAYRNLMEFIHEYEEGAMSRLLHIPIS